MEIQKEIGADLAGVSDAEIRAKTAAIRSEVLIIQSELNSLYYEVQNVRASTKANRDKIKLNKQLPYLVGSVTEKYPREPGCCMGAGVVNTTTRVSSYLPLLGLVDESTLEPGDLVALHKETNLVLEKLPPDYDTRVKAMEVDEKPLETYDDIGGLERQIEELNEAIVLPFTHPERFTSIGVSSPKGVLLYGPPGTGKTLMARACAAKTSSTFLKLAGPQLVQMYIGDGARLVRDTFALAREKAPTIVFIDEIDAIGTKRVDSDRTGDREVQRTMLELLNQLDGFSTHAGVKVIAATNRVDILDPALLRSGRIDRKIEFPLPNLEGRTRILQINCRKMAIGEIHYDEIARCTDGFNGAMLKAVCVEAGVAAMRRDADEITHNDFMNAIGEVLSAKKSKYTYFT